MLACNEKDLTEPLTREMLRFGNHFVDSERDAKNWIVARETAIPAIVDAFIGKIERGEQAHFPPKIPQCERTRSLHDRFEFPIGFRRDQVPETLNQLRFPQSQVVQGFDERHQNNFVRVPAFANADQPFDSEKPLSALTIRRAIVAMRVQKKAASVVPDAAVAKCYCCLESEVHAGAHHAEVIVRTIHKIPAEVTDPADMRGQADFHTAADLTDCPRLTAGMRISENVRVFTVRKRISFATAED